MRMIICYIVAVCFLGAFVLFNSLIGFLVWH